MRAVSRLLATAAVVLAAAPAPADPKDDASRKALKELEGRWKVTEILKNGKNETAIENLNLEVTFKGQTLKITAENPNFPPIDRFIRLDAAFAPKLLDLAVKDEEFGKEKVYEGLFSRDGDTLKWCFALESDEIAKGTRPAAVESKPGSNSLLVTFKRVKE